MEKIEFFKSLGLTDYEAKAITSLIRLKVASPKEISLDSGVPQNKLYHIISKFKEMNILAEIPSEVKKFKLINLKTFVNNKIRKREKDLKEIKDSSKNIEEESEDEFVFSLIKGQKAIMNRLAEKNPEVKKEILGVQRNWKAWGKGLDSMKRSMKKDLDVKMIGVVNNKTKEKALEWKKLGCKIRAYNESFGKNPLRFTIFDNKEARITLGKPEISEPKDYITIWTKSKPLINTLRSQFMAMWKESKKL